MDYCAICDKKYNKNFNSHLDSPLHAKRQIIKSILPPILNNDIKNIIVSYDLATYDNCKAFIYYSEFFNNIMVKRVINYLNKQNNKKYIL